MMIKRLYVLLFLSVIIVPSFSQQLRRNFERELSVGLTGGLNMSKVSFLHNDTYRMNELGDQSFRQGVRLGVISRFISQKHFGIQVEFNYVRAGWSERFFEDYGQTIVNGYDLQNVVFSRRLDYFEIPILAHIYFGQKRVRFFIELGPEVSFLTKYGEMIMNINLKDERLKAIPSDDPRWMNQHNKLDYGLTGGAGLDVKVGLLHAIIGGRYTYGFGNLYDSNKSDVFQRSNNQLIGVTASILIPVLKYTEKKR